MSTFDWDSWLLPLQPTGAAVAALQPGSSVVVYGAGQAAQDVIHLLTRKQVQVRYLIDAKSNRSELAGLAVQRPDDPSIPEKERATTTVVLGIFNAFVDITALTGKLAGWGWPRVIDFVELHALWPEELGDRYWLTRRSFLHDHAAKIVATDALWADAASRELYRQLLRFRVSGDRRSLPAPDCERQYFATDVPAWPAPLRMVDCGACDGDTLLTIERVGIPVEALALFEPDPANFKKLSAKAASFGARQISALAWPCAVSDTTALLRFSSNRGAASALDAGGDLVIPGVALDDVLSGFRPNLIKMDIEGAERAALLGARNLIEQHRPGLAICVYHLPDDLWALPALVASWGLGYKFYLRSHQYSDFDVVLYALSAS